MASRLANPVRLLFGVTFFVMGPCALLWAVVSAYNTHVFLSRSIAVPATIVGMHAQQNLRSVTNYAPVFTFTADDGRTYTVTSYMGSSVSTFEVGEHVTAHYDTGHPEQARLATFGQLWMFDLIVGAVSVFGTLLFLVVVFGRMGPPRVYKRSDFPPSRQMR